MKKIIVIRRGSDWLAHPEGDSARWGCGKTPPEAIGQLITAHPEHFGLIIVIQAPKTEE